MSLSARGALHLEHVPERVVLGVVGAQVGDAVFRVSGYALSDRGAKCHGTNPESSAVSVRANISGRFEALCTNMKKKKKISKFQESL